MNYNLVKIREIDIVKTDAPQQLLALISDLGGMDLYVHVAGTGKQNTEIITNIETATVKTNVFGFVNIIDTAFNYMVNNGGGHIAAITSIAGTKGLGAAPAYGASKAFQNCYLQALEQLANNRRLNIRFTDIRPGFVDTELLNGGKYPMKMNVNKVAHLSVKAIYDKKHIAVIDWRYMLITCFWRLIPNCLWRKINLIERIKIKN